MNFLNYSKIKRMLKNRSYQLIIQLGSLALITIAGPLIIALIFLKQGNL